MAQHASDLITTMSEQLPRFKIYTKLQSDPLLQTALFNVYTDVLEFSVKVYHHFKKGALSKCMRTSKAEADWMRKIARLATAVLRPTSDLFLEDISRLKRHS